jgi:hypothetical protein
MLLRYCYMLFLLVFPFLAFSQAEEVNQEEFYPDNIFLDTVNVSVYQEKNEEFYRTRFSLAKNVSLKYSKELRQLNEKPYHKNPYEFYRFLWTSSLGNPISIRVENRDGVILLFVKEGDWLGETFNQRAMKSDTVLLSLSDWEHIKNELVTSNFWKLQTIETADLAYCNPSIWILEGKKENSYHLVERVYAREKEIGKICMFLLEKSGLRIKLKRFH